MVKAPLLLVVGIVSGVLVATFTVSDSGILSSTEGESDSLLPAREFNSSTAATGVSAASQAVTPHLRTLESMALLIGEDPISALAAALQATDPAKRHGDVGRIGAAWALYEPVAALAFANMLPPELRHSYRSSIAAEWANLDPEGFLAYAERSGSLVELTAGLELLIPTNPRRVFDLAVRLPTNESQVVNSLQTDALSALLELDPLSTLIGLESMQPSAKRDELMNAAALRYGRLDPEGAVAWMATLESPQSTIRQNVIRGMVATDFDRAYALVQGEDPMSQFPASLVLGAIDVPGSLASTASNLARRDDDFASSVLSNILSLWADANPDGVADWLLLNETNISASFAGTVAGQIAQVDLQRALDDLDRIPFQWRDEWIPEIAGAYARQDARAAIDWISQLRGEPAYEAAFNQVAMNAAESDPRSAAQLVQNASPALQAAAANYIANTYALTDPLAAAQWALGLQSQDAISTAAAGVAYGWATKDPLAAQRWALELPRGDTRNAVVTQLMRRSDVFDIDPTLFLDEFSSPEARSAGITSAANMLSARDPPRAKLLLEAVADDPDLGEWAQQRLSGTR